MKAILMALVTGCLIVALTSAQSRSASDQYQEALRLEEIKGDLNGAIELYRKLAQGTDRAIAAKALVQMAGCYEKLGQMDARQAYERVAKEFADQIEPAAYARVRLASLGATSMASAANVPVKRRILADLGRTVQSVSLDGRYAIVGDAADLVILDLRTGNRRRVRQGNARTREAPEGESAWSRDGKQVAFNWEYREPSYRTELRLVAFNGSGDRLLYRKDEIDHIDVVDWTPDGKSILVGLEHVSTNAEDIAFISATDGSVRVLKTMDTGLDNLALSPDGSWIAYSAPRRINEPRDVFVIAADGTREAQIVQNPADDLVLAWAPDGRSVLFSSNRSGSTEVWSVPIRDGRPTGYPQFLRLGLGDVAFRGSTPGGRLYYGVNAGAARDTYIGRLDPATGNVAGPLEPVPTRHATRNGAAAWSPNGRQLASWTNAPNQAIAIFAVDTAQEREIRPRNLGIDHPIRWTPDGSALLFTARVLDAAEAPPRVITRNLYRLQVETEEVRLLVPAVPGGTIHAGDLSPDGRTLYYLVNAGSIGARDLATGQERMLYTAPAGHIVAGLTIAPRGDRLAFRDFVNDSNASSLTVLPVTGGEPQTVLQLNDPTLPSHRRMIAWSGDGRHLYFMKALVPGVTQELWRVASQGGTPERAGLTMDDVSMLFSFNPDGQRFAVSTSRPGKSELWVLENFLTSRASR